MGFWYFLWLYNSILYHVRKDRTYNLSSPLTPNIGGKIHQSPSVLGDLGGNVNEIADVSFTIAMLSDMILYHIYLFICILSNKIHKFFATIFM